MSSSPEFEKLLESVEALGRYEFKNRDERYRAMQATRAVSDKLQRPYEKFIEMWGGISKDAAVKVGIDVCLWVKWAEASEKVQTASQLAEMTGVELALMAGLLKHLATWHIVAEEGPDTYSPTEYSLALSRPEMAACVNLHFDAFILTFPKLPGFLKVNGYKRPTDAQRAPFGWAYNWPGNFFEYTGVNKQCNDSINMCMQMYTHYRGSWLDVFPGEQLLEKSEPDQTLLVDVGGGLGHDVEDYRKRFPEQSKDRLIVQDLTQVIETIKDLDPGIRRMSHDFLTEQPVKGARAYYLHHILHDWPDDGCRKILEALKPAMKKGESRVLINEVVVPAQGAIMSDTTHDMIMMNLFGARERDEGAWHDLLGSVGMKVLKIWFGPLAEESIIGE
ncbi:MAG: hypothetical protein M1831_007103 [Alyxoria varia]|nr:MAG: hypothetical protein M1831_007103 [Alyxoria varia]